MQKIILLWFALCITGATKAQYTFTATVKDAKTKEPLIGATAVVTSLSKGSTADQNGQLIINNIPKGKQEIIFSFLGYESKKDSFHFPLPEEKNIIVYLQTTGEEIQEVIVNSTRTSRSIDNVPTRVEMVELEEIEEKLAMRPANVSMLLHESTGIQVQQTSATSGNASIRIQGLDGRYTQLLKDGFANFGNFASGLSILEIPPLDLKQVEIIKGPVSTLYGGGAIAGVIDFISKTPEEKAEYDVIINQSNVGQSDFGTFAMQRGKKTGYSLLAQYNYQKAYDVNKDDFSDLSLSKNISINPKLFFYPTDKTTIYIGNSFSHGDKTGGDMQVINEHADSLHIYYEKNNTQRNVSSLEWNQEINDNDRFTARSSFSHFKRSIAIPDYAFAGTNYNSFSDLNYLHKADKQVLVIGANYVFEHFEEQAGIMSPLRNYTVNTGGLYAQHTWDIKPRIVLESGLRGDMAAYGNSNYKKTEVFILPRASVLFKFTDRLSSRIGSGFGYKSPTLFTEQTEALLYRNVETLNGVTAERSYGGTADINYKWSVTNDLYISINQMVFFTVIRNATLLQADSAAHYYFRNTDKSVQSNGLESNLKVIFKENLKFFAGYTYTHAIAKYLKGNQRLPLLPVNRINMALVYEKENEFKIGLESYFSDHQYLSNGTTTPRFWEFGAMAQKTFGHVSVFINFENFTDVRQSRYKNVVNPPHDKPTFDEIWTHVEGFIFNGGLKFKF